MVKARVLWQGAAAEPDRRGGLMALFNRVPYGGELGEVGTERGGRGKRIAGFAAEIEIESGPLMVIWTLVPKHMGLVEPTLETSD